MFEHICILAQPELRGRFDRLSHAPKGKFTQIASLLYHGGGCFICRPTCSEAVWRRQFQGSLKSQSNKRWDILTSMWEDLHNEICSRSGQEWDLLAAGAMRDPHDLREYESYRKQLEILEGKGLGHYF